MNLHSASNYFDKTACVDAYNPATKFLAQLDLFDDTKRDGLTVERRILSTSPSVNIPARRTIVAEGIAWVVGKKNVDTFLGKPIRHKYEIHRAEALGNVRTPKQKLTTGGLPVYSSAVWVKDSKEVESSSRLYSFMNTYFAQGEAISAGDILSLGASDYRIRNVYMAASGIQVGEANVMPKDSLQPITYKSLSAQVYDPTTDSFGTGVVTVFNALWERFQDSFYYESAAAPKYENGDVLLVIQKTSVALPKAGDTLVLLGESWIVVSLQDDQRLCWELQVRRA